MRVLPVAAGALALLDDLVDRGQRRGEVGDRDQLRPVESAPVWPGRAASRRTPPAHRADRPGRAARRRCPGRGGRRCANSWPRGSASSGVTGSRGGAVGTKPSASWRSIPSGRSRYRKCRSACSPNGSRSSCTPAGKYPDRCGKLGRPNVRRGADRGHEVGDQRQVQHLLDGDAAQRRAPPVDRLGLLGGRAHRRRRSLRLNSANRYWHMIMCSSWAASASSHHRCSRFATTTLGSAMTPSSTL